MNAYPGFQRWDFEKHEPKGMSKKTDGTTDNAGQVSLFGFDDEEVSNEVWENVTEYQQYCGLYGHGGGEEWVCELCGARRLK